MNDVDPPAASANVAVMLADRLELVVFGATEKLIANVSADVTVTQGTSGVAEVKGPHALETFPEKVLEPPFASKA